VGGFAITSDAGHLTQHEILLSCPCNICKTQ